jgi:hypothetical protein
MAKPPQHRAPPDHSGTPLHKKAEANIRAYEYISSQASIYNTRPTRGGEILHHQITLENHCRAERLKLIFVLTNTSQTKPASTTLTQHGVAKSYITRTLWKATAKRKGWSLYSCLRIHLKPNQHLQHSPNVGQQHSA